MNGAFPHKWTSALGDLPVNDDGSLTRTGAIWQRGLTGIDDVMLRRGFEECVLRADEWPPSLPGFRAMAMGVPSLAAVKADLRGTTLPHERAQFTRLVWQYLDHYRMARSDSETSERLLREAYELAVDYILHGGPMPEASKALTPAPPQPRTPAKPETVEKCMAIMHRALGIPTETDANPEATPA
jgi:hypothetical protein